MNLTFNLYWIKWWWSIFDKEGNIVDLELFLNDPFLAEKYKKNIEILNPNIFVTPYSDTNKSFFNALKVRKCNVYYTYLNYNCGGI